MLYTLKNVCAHHMRTLVFVLAALFFGTGAVMPAYAAKGDTGKDQMVQPVNVALGKAEIVNLDRRVADLMLADPSIADVNMLKSSNVYIVGKSVGSTNLIALDDKGEVVKRINVNVGLNLGQLRNKINTMYPDAEVDISALGEQVVIDGVVENGDRAARISRVVASYVGEKIDSEGSVDEIVENMLKVRSGQQVMLRVRVVEAQRDVLRELGVGPSFNQNNTAFETLSQDDIAGTLSSVAGTGLTANPFAQANAFVDTGLDGIGIMRLFIRALEQENMINVLSEPNLTAISGERAGFLAGGEFPVPTGRDSNGNVSVEFRDFGVSLDFRPEVISPERINLQLETEVSSLNPGAGITLAGINVPGLDVRRASTTVELNSGGSLMIAGLLKSEAVNNMAGLPGVRENPVLGKLAGSDSFQRNETELVVIITPMLVDGMKNTDSAEKVSHVYEEKQEKEGETPLEEAFKRNISAAYDNSPEALDAENSENVGYILE